MRSNDVCPIAVATSFPVAPRSTAIVEWSPRRDRRYGCCQPRVAVPTHLREPQETAKRRRDELGGRRLALRRTPRDEIHHLPHADADQPRRTSNGPATLQELADVPCYWLHVCGVAPRALCRCASYSAMATSTAVGFSTEGVRICPLSRRKRNK